MPQAVFDALEPGAIASAVMQKEQFEARVKGVDGPLALVRVGLRTPAPST
jgi:hypothetical protein